MPTRTTIAFVCFVCSVAVPGCDSADAPEPLFPKDYAATYQEVRNCRRSGDHALAYVRILADAKALSPYRTRTMPFPEGAVVLKVEHADADCKDISGFTVMRKQAVGSVPAAGDWLWQELKADRQVLQQGAPARCVNCHRSCGVAPDGYGWTCAAP